MKRLCGFSCSSATYKHRNLSHFTCLGSSFLICKIKVLNQTTSRSCPAPTCWDCMITLALLSGPHDHLDLKKVARLPQHYKRLLGKSRMQSFYSALEPPHPSIPLSPFRQRAWLKENIQLQFHRQVDRQIGCLTSHKTIPFALSFPAYKTKLYTDDRVIFF